jgi:hypothetical protein
MRSPKNEEMCKVLFKEQHPMEKVKRGGTRVYSWSKQIPRGRYRLLEAELE